MSINFEVHRFHVSTPVPKRLTYHRMWMIYEIKCHIEIWDWDMVEIYYYPIIRIWSHPVPFIPMMLDCTIIGKHSQYKQHVPTWRSQWTEVHVVHLSAVTGVLLALRMQQGHLMVHDRNVIDLFLQKVADDLSLRHLPADALVLHQASTFHGYFQSVFAKRQTEKVQKMDGSLGCKTARRDSKCKVWQQSKAARCIVAYKAPHLP